MAYVATILTDDNEQFTATGISINEGKLEFTGTTLLTSRSNKGKRVDSATAGAVNLASVQKMTVA